ncbi:MAG TPA: response regulator, partial [Vicinamibacteria bacterium]
MSLNGNLEDLPLLDILQIVSFSKKTGYLSIRAAPLGEGAIVFKDGLVVCSFAWDAEPLGASWAGLPPAEREALIRKRIEVALQTLIRLREGQFSFNLTDEAPSVVAGRPIEAETLAAGWNPQELLLDLARGMDEDRRDSQAAVEESFAEDAATPPFGAPARRSDPTTRPVPVVERETPPEAGRETAGAAPASDEPAPTPPAAGPRPTTLLLVDDEEDVRRVLTLVFEEAGYVVIAVDDPELAVKTGGRLGKEEVPFILVTDLGMPTSGGSSFHGGFEVVKRLAKMNLRPPVLMMTESLSPALQLRARQMRIGSFIFKPGLSKLNPKQFEADLLTFAQRIVVDVLPRLESSLATVPIRRKAKAEARDGAPAPRLNADPDELTRHFRDLQRRLADLRRPTEAKEISLLVMKVAREYFERGVLFLVRHEELKGLGGFGPAPKGHSLNVLAREVVVSLAEPSIFRDVVVGAQSYSGLLPEARA